MKVNLKLNYELTPEEEEIIKRLLKYEGKEVY